MNLCKDCKHFIPKIEGSAGIFGPFFVPSRCRISDLIGDGTGIKSCVEERASNSGVTCGGAGRNWEAK